MAVTWQSTTLSTSPAYHEMADTDRHALTFSAPSGFTVATVATVLEVAPAYEAVDGLIVSTTVNAGNDGAVVILAGLTRGNLYRLSVTMTAADDGTVTGILAIRCVA